MQTTPTGNLPFTATKSDIEKHFSSLQPTSVRLLTEKGNPKRSRGIAFVEFGEFGHMKTCLAKFHHTEFADADGNMRRINVELTAGGGGKTPARQDKIKAKNVKLNEERARRIQAEEEAKAAEKKKGGAGGEGEAKGDANKKDGGAEPQPEDEDWVHPSRRGQMGAGGEDNDDSDDLYGGWSAGRGRDGARGRGRGRGGGRGGRGRGGRGGGRGRRF